METKVITFKPQTDELTKLGEHTAARGGWPVWVVGEKLVIKGVAWRIASIELKEKMLFLVVENPEKEPGLKAMCDRLAGQKTPS
ncbi:MAG: hypothetical protein KGJ13_02325 [Patescibacteria group bacterium]|nr:hypothetical protein [Patescibacteria group bacterium]